MADDWLSEEKYKLEKEKYNPMAKKKKKKKDKKKKNKKKKR